MENKKGFTMAELLIVVAIIAVLVAVAIPVFNNQLEKSRQSVDLSNLRNAYAAARAAETLGEAAGEKIATTGYSTFYYDLSGNLLTVAQAEASISGAMQMKAKSAELRVDISGLPEEIREGDINGNGPGYDTMLGDAIGDSWPETYIRIIYKDGILDAVDFYDGIDEFE